MRITSIIPTAKTTVKDLEVWIRSVTDLLNGKWTIGDQASGAVMRFRWNSDAAPMTVPLQSTQRPISVLCLAAQPPRSPDVSTAGVTWRWAPTKASGAIEISAMPGLTASTDYDVTLWVVGG